MSHLMETINPEAVNTAIPDELPEQGEMVTYITRPGEGRSGQREFPAIVMRQNDARGRFGLDLLVLYDAMDLVTLQSVQMHDETYDVACWQRRPGSDDTLRTEVRALREEIAALRRAVFGDWNEPDQGLMDYLVDFEKRTKAVEAAVAKTTKAPAAKKAKAKA